MAKGPGGNNSSASASAQGAGGMNQHNWQRQQQGQVNSQPVGQPQVQQPATNPRWGNLQQRVHNMTDWWSLMRNQNPTDYFSSMYKAQQPAPTPTPTTITPVSSTSQGLLSTPYNPNTGMPI